MDGGKVTDEEVEWWKQHLEEEGQMSHPTQPLASSFNHHRIPTQDFVNPPSLDNLRQHVGNLTKESNVSLKFFNTCMLVREREREGIGGIKCTGSVLLHTFMCWYSVRISSIIKNIWTR